MASRMSRLSFTAFASFIVSCGVIEGQPSVTTQRYDAFRTSSNLQETILSPSTVTGSSFGLLWTYPVDGDVYAQPLYVRNVNVAGAGVRNVLYVVTMHDVIYAFNADAPGPPLWTVDLRNPAAGITPYYSASFANQEWVHAIGDAFGIHSTPVIDPNSNLMYLVAQTSEPAGVVYRLHAFDIRSGAEPIPPVVIQATSQGIVFNPALQNQRPALALSGGQVYIGFGGRPADDPPYHGWLMTYSAATLQQSGVFVVNATSNGGAIWQGGGGPAADENGNIYAVSGNGFGNGDGVTNFSESLMKFTYSAGQLNLADWFTPADNATLDANDWDLGPNGPMVIPGAGLVALGSKTADFYMSSTSNLGKLTTNDAGLAQTFHIGTGYPAQYGDSNLTIGLALWPKPSGSVLFAWPAQDFLYSYTLSGTQFSPAATSTVQSHSAPGAGMVVTANGTQSGTGILWAEMSLVPGGDSVGLAGVLRAFNADTLTELWDSNMNTARDGIASAAKFAVPTVVNGRVYAPTFAGVVQVYGLLSSQNFSLTANSTALTVSQGSSGTASVTDTGLNGFNGVVSYSASGMPSGVTVSFSPATSVSGGQTTATVAVASTAAAGGTYPITITGTGGSLTQTVTVSLTVPVHTPPTVSITAPANNATFATGSSIAITAQASATGATVSQVTFLNGGVTLGTVTAAPYAFNWTNAPAGTYQLTAQATDSLGGSTTSTPVTVVVLPPVSVTIAPSTVTLTANQPQQFAATVANSTNTGVTWSTPVAGTLTATGLYTAPASITSQSTVTITATSVADTTKSATATITLSPGPSDYSVAVTPASLSLAQGGSTNTQVSVSPLRGFTGSPSFTITGLPANVTGSFSPASSSTGSTLTITAASTAAPGSYTATITGTSGTLVHSVTLSLTVTALSSSFVGVSLASGVNVYAIYPDGTATQHGALDGLGDAYSSNLLGSSIDALGVTFTLGSPSVADAVSSATIPLPAGNFASLKFLATGNNGGGYPITQSQRNRPNETFTVTYTDGSSTTFTQSLSDLATPQNYPGETIVDTMSHMVNSRGGLPGGPWYLYGYSFTLNSAKTVKSFGLPNDRGVVVLAAALVSGSAPPPKAVELSAAANVYGIFADGVSPTHAGLDNDGYAYSANLLGSSVNALNVTFTLGGTGVADAASSTVVSLPNGNYGSLKFLATGVNGNQTSQTFVVTYTDGSKSTFTQSLSDWFTPQNYPGETTASTMAYRVGPYGVKDYHTFRLYGYSFSLNSAKTVQSVTLPNNRNVVVLGIYIQ
jgi:hypothetical protein